MMRYVCFAIAALLSTSLFSQDKTLVDPISEKLTEAKATYRRDLEAAKQSLLKEIEARIERVKKNFNLSVEEQLSILKELATQRETFVVDSGKLPSQKKLQSKVSKFKRKVVESRNAMEAAFDKAADAYRRPPLKDFEAAAAIMEERKTFFEVKLKPANIGFEPAFNDDHWVASSPKWVNVKSGQLRISAAGGENVVLTRKSDYETANVIVEFSAEKETEAYIVIHAQKKDGKWTGATSRIDVGSRKMMVGALGPGFQVRPNRQKDYGIGDSAKMHLIFQQHPEPPDRFLCYCWANKKSLKHIAHEWDRYNVPRTGAVGFIVKKGAIAVKTFAVTEERFAKKTK